MNRRRTTRVAQRNELFAVLACMFRPEFIALMFHEASSRHRRVDEHDQRPSAHGAREGLRPLGRTPEKKGHMRLVDLEL